MRLKEKKTTHVIFDLDGTLIDSEQFYTQACQNIATMYGRVFTESTNKAIRGLSQRDATPILLNETGLDKDLTVPEFNTLLHKVMSPLLPQCTLMPGAIETIKHLAFHKIPMAICTGSKLDELQLKLQNLSELKDLIPIIVTGDDPEVGAGKPAPDPFLATMRRFTERPEKPTDVLVFEDTIIGVRGAMAAGTRVTLVYDKRYTNPPVNLPVECAVSSFKKLDLSVLGLPPFQQPITCH